MTEWNYCGDVGIRYGGFYWREADADDYVLCVDVTPTADCGGPDNLFWIESGNIYIGTNAARIESALSCIGVKPDEATRRDIVYAMKAYHGIDDGTIDAVQIGKAQEARPEFGDDKEPIVLRGNASLRRYVERNYL